MYTIFIPNGLATVSKSRRSVVFAKKLIFQPKIAASFGLAVRGRHFENTYEHVTSLSKTRGEGTGIVPKNLKIHANLAKNCPIVFKDAW